MKNNKIYILHEYGSNSHYRALKYLCDTKDKKIIYREFNITKSLIKSILRRDFQLFKKQFINIIFLINLLFTKNKKVILGVAPYDFRLIFLSLILRNHKVYYHTSWTCWDRSFYPKKLFVGSWLIGFWEKYVKNKFIKIFAVSAVTQDELVKNLNVDENKIIVVNHSYDDTIYNYSERDVKKRFLYVGRFEAEKGIDEILDYFSKKNNLLLTLVGDGSLTGQVKKFSNQYNNIKYISFVSDQKKLVEIYNEHDILLLNSKKVGNWEELFGMVLIEAMACGVIPIATDHKGPKEIISDEIDGFVSSEKNFINRVDTLVNSNIDFLKVRENTIVSAKKYSTKEIAKRWEFIFE